MKFKTVFQNILRFSKTSIFQILIFAGCLFIFSKAFAQSTRSQQGSSSSSGSARTGVLFDIHTYYGLSEETTDSIVYTESKTTESVFDIKLGYIFKIGFYIGAEHSVRNAGFVNWSTTGHGTGLGIGYFFKNGTYLRGFYRFNEVYNDFRDGTGSQFEAGYMQLFATNFYLGLALSQREIKFPKRDSDLLLNSYKYKAIYPMLVLGFLIN